MVKIGMMIGDRYEILEKIGTGGMSDVYKAKCHKLNRYVAVKVLKQEFSENESFVSKFRTEAQAAAGLMHPNIVNVYDVGEEEGIYYIVMELVEGITLKKYIEKKARLSYKEAVSIAIQVSMGIEVAHNNHIIHRDIKPQNIIISRDGKVKVTDFGIAKAATSNTITSNVMGSVHYTSPEQARGGYSDEKSDIYSLGITMFEMLTGRVPFNGETTVAIAIKHIQEELPSPKEFVPEIPNSVESIVMKCCQKSPDRRYQNMQELLADLKQSLVNPDDDFVVQNVSDMGGTRMISKGDMEQIKRRTAVSQEPQEYEEQENNLHLQEEDPGYEEEGAEDCEDYDYDPKMERMTTFLALAGGIVFCVVAVVLAINVFGSHRIPEEGSSSPIIVSDPPEEEEPETEYKKMPSVAGKTVEDARNQLNQLGILAQVDYEESDDVALGVVIRADVSEGSDVEVGSTVTLTASAGSQGVEVPPVTGDTYERASASLASLGFVVNRLEGYSSDVEAGLVISQFPTAATKAPRGTEVTLTVSLGKEPVEVPNFIGLKEEDGIITAIEQGLIMNVVMREYRSEYEEGQIYYQSYSKGTFVNSGTVIDVRVSKGPEPVAPQTYRCNASITAPTPEEAPGYVAGTEVHVKLVTDAGEVLLETKTTGFPQAANFYNLTSSGGTITMTYTVKPEPTSTTGPDGEPIVIEGEPEERSFTRRIDFVPE